MWTQLQRNRIKLAIAKCNEGKRDPWAIACAFSDALEGIYGNDDADKVLRAIKFYSKDCKIEPSLSSVVHYMNFHKE